MPVLIISVAKVKQEKQNKTKDTRISLNELMNEGIPIPEVTHPLLIH